MDEDVLATDFGMARAPIAPARRLSRDVGMPCPSEDVAAGIDNIRSVTQQQQQQLVEEGEQMLDENADHPACSRRDPPGAWAPGTVQNNSQWDHSVGSSHRPEVPSAPAPPSNGCSGRFHHPMRSLRSFKTNSVRANETAVQTVEGTASQDILAGYELDPTPLGKGATAAVYRAVPYGDDGAAQDSALAVKVLERRPPPGDELQNAKLEVELLTASQPHPNVVRFFGLTRVETSSLGLPPGDARWALVLEHIEGGDLFDVATKAVFAESTAARVMQGILSALAHIHARSIVHRDVKSENVLIASDGRPILVDFGTAAYLSDKEGMKRRCGSPGYCAPEVILGAEYGTLVDIFGAGVICFFILCGKTPFRGKSTEDTLKKTLAGKVKFNSYPQFESVDASCKTFVKTLLQREASERPAAQAVLSHEWLTQHLSADTIAEALALCSVEPAATEFEPPNASMLRTHAQNATAALEISRARAVDGRVGYPQAPPGSRPTALGRIGAQKLSISTVAEHAAFKATKLGGDEYSLLPPIGTAAPASLEGKDASCGRLDRTSFQSTATTATGVASEMDRSTGGNRSTFDERPSYNTPTFHDKSSFAQYADSPRMFANQGFTSEISSSSHYENSQDVMFDIPFEG